MLVNFTKSLMFLTQIKPATTEMYAVMSTAAAGKWLQCIVIYGIVNLVKGTHRYNLRTSLYWFNRIVVYNCYGWRQVNVTKRFLPIMQLWLMTQCDYNLSISQSSTLYECINRRGSIEMMFYRWHENTISSIYTATIDKKDIKGMKNRDLNLYEYCWHNGSQINFIRFEISRNQKIKKCMFTCHLRRLKHVLLFQIADQRQSVKTSKISSYNIKVDNTNLIQRLSVARK